MNSRCSSIQPPIPALKKTHWIFNSLKFYILPEEDLGVTQPELLLVQLDDVHHSSSGSLVVLGLGHCSSTQDVVACFKLRIVDLQNKKIIKKII